MNKNLVTEKITPTNDGVINELEKQLHEAGTPMRGNWFAPKGWIPTEGQPVRAIEVSVKLYDDNDGDEHRRAIYVLLPASSGTETGIIVTRRCVPAYNDYYDDGLLGSFTASFRDPDWHLMPKDEYLKLHGEVSTIREKLGL